jgi:hypothetical protein
VTVVLYYHTDPQREFIRERHEDLAQEMRRVRQLTAEEAAHPRWTRLAAELIRRVQQRLGRRDGYKEPAYDA